MAAKGFGGWFGLGLVAVVVAVAAAAALLLVPTGMAGAQGAECRYAGVVPGSVKVTSSNNLAGEGSRHTIRFQLCLNAESAAHSIGNGVEAARPAEIGLLWDDWFYMEHPEQAGITLMATGDGKSWDAADAFAKRACSFRTEGTGVTVGFVGDELNDLVPSGKNAPVSLQFDIPASAGMLNPAYPDDYRWRIVLRYDRGDYWETYTGESVATVITPTFSTTAGINTSENFVSPGSTVTVAGHGFLPNSPVQRVRVGSVDVTPDGPAFADAQGNFRLDIIIPGLDDGRHVLLVQMNDITATTIVLIPPIYWDPATPVMYALENLGDNFVRAFHFIPDIESWTFYDPEIPEVNTLSYLIAGECYWILVKEPMEVILNRQTRQLACQPDGNCWNLIVW